MNLIFFYPPPDDMSLTRENKTFSLAPPLGILYLAKIIEEEGHKVKIIDLRADFISEEKLQKELTGTDIIGVSIPSYSLYNSRLLCSWIKKYDSNVPIIIGGPHCSLYPKKSLQNINADISINGEGEKTITKVIKALARGKNPRIPGVFYKDNQNDVQGLKGHNIIDNLNTLSFPSRHLVKNYDYGYFFGYKFFKGKTTAVLTSRGCPFKCKFCSRYITGMDNYRERSAENVIAEMEKIHDQGYKSVIIADDNFLVNRKRAHLIFDNLIRKKINLEMFIQGARIDSITEKLAEKMKQAGVTTIAFGIESGNQSILNFYNKQITLDQIKKTINLCNRIGFFTIGNFILGAPIEDNQHIKNTIHFARSLPLDFALFLILEYTAGAPLWKRAVKRGNIQKDEYRVTTDSNRGLGLLSLQELEEWQQKAYTKFYLNTNYLKRQLKNMLQKKDFSMVKAASILLKQIFS